MLVNISLSTYLEIWYPEPNKDYLSKFLTISIFFLDSRFHKPILASMASAQCAPWWPSIKSAFCKFGWENTSCALNRRDPAAMVDALPQCNFDKVGRYHFWKHPNLFITLIQNVHRCSIRNGIEFSSIPQTGPSSSFSFWVLMCKIGSEPFQNLNSKSIASPVALPRARIYDGTDHYDLNSFHSHNYQILLLIRHGKHNLNSQHLFRAPGYFWLAQIAN